jgi:MFS family permease
MSAPGRVIRSYFLISGLYTLAAALIWGVNTLFLLEAGLDIFEVFLANAAFTAGSTLFEIPTGVLADTRGRRASFLLSVAILFLTTLGYVAVARLGGGLWEFAAVSVVMGLGFTFYSGAIEAWLVDALHATGYEGQLDRVFARGSMITGVAMLLGTAGGGFLGNVDLALPYVVRSGLLVAAFVTAYFLMHDQGFSPRALRASEIAANMRRVGAESITYGWNRRSVRLLMFCSFLQFGFLTWGFYAWQPYFLELLERDAVWVAGVVAALIAASTIVGNGLVDWFSRYCGKRTTLLLGASAVQTAAAIGVGLADSFEVALALFLVVTAAMGVIGPTKQAYLHTVIPSPQRASVISFHSMMGSAGGILGQSGLGYVSRFRSIADGYVLGGLATILTLPVLGALRRLGDPADVIVGKKCGCPEAACAAQGLPPINLVDSTPRRAEA